MTLQWSSGAKTGSEWSSENGKRPSAASTSIDGQASWFCCSSEKVEKEKSMPDRGGGDKGGKEAGGRGLGPDII